ncbi:MAG: DUF1015 domain-containing protein [Lachnospiraceae bacterium]|nr:DUF1015 domain-containing protein [Lachnospiraceae bacterium]MBQ9233726.1 DUF1015 domain-containing protein [Lachnospiraceae bacterium]
MALVKTFEAYRPRTDIVDEVAALPYDVYNRQEAKEAVAGKPLSFLRIDRAETAFDDDMDMYSPLVYAKAKELLDGMIERGEYIKEDKPVYYIYELVMDGRAQTGIVACASIDDYISGVIKKHENTREEKEIDRITHVDVCNAQTGPIFLAYRAKKAIDEIVDKVKQTEAVYSFVSDDGIGHSVWIISDDNDIETIRNEFEKLSDIYIADGHHRAASAVKVGIKRRNENPDADYRESDYFLSVLFPHDQLKILPYNRVVKDLNGLSFDEFMDKVKDKFDVEEKADMYQPEEKCTFGMYILGKWYKLTAKDDLRVDDPVLGLDVSILQNNLLEPVLGINDPRVDKRIDFVGGIRGLKELERRVSQDMEIAFSMYPTSIDELFSVADAGMLMPPKSTWFEPKLRSGIFIHKL